MTRTPPLPSEDEEDGSADAPDFPNAQYYPSQRHYSTRARNQNHQIHHDDANYREYKLEKLKGEAETQFCYKPQSNSTVAYEHLLRRLSP